MMLLVVMVNVCLVYLIGEKDSEQDVCETPDVLGELNNSIVGANSNKNQ